MRSSKELFDIRKMKVEDFYAQRLQYGGPRFGINYAKRKYQRERFKVVADCIEKMFPYADYDLDVLDVGCGVGDFYDFVRRRRWLREYIGVDITKEFVKICESEHGSSRTRFYEGDVLKGLGKRYKSSVAVSIGVFYHFVYPDDFRTALRNMNRVATRAFIFDVPDESVYRGSFCSRSAERIMEECSEYGTVWLRKCGDLWIVIVDKKERI